MNTTSIRTLIVVVLFFPLLILMQCSNKAKEKGTPLTKKEPSLKEMIGEMVIVGIDGTTLSQNPSVIKYLKGGNLGGIILYEKNIAKTNSKKQLTALCNEIQNQSTKKVFIGIDQEGGTVNRLKTKYGFPRSVTAKSLGDLDNLDTTKFYANEMVKTLNDLGINVNFTPCVDLCSNPHNPIIAKYGRCFSSDPELVVKHASIFSDAHLNGRVLPVIKHFPGHGSSKGDTHLGMADVTDVWTENELVPYRQMISAGKAPAIMSAHIINAKLDPDTLPSTLSQPILTGMLREELGFEGLIFSDDMQMRAISDHYGLEHAIELAVNAGVDVLMFSGNIPGTKTPTIDKVFKAFEKLIEEGKISKGKLQSAYNRIKKTKEML